MDWEGKNKTIIYADGRADDIKNITVVLQKNERKRMERKIIEKKIWIFIVVLIAILGIISYLYFGEEQIQRRIRGQIYNKVIEQEDELSKIVEEGALDEILYFKEVKPDIDSSIKFTCYRELEDERINKVFQEFFLMSISGDPEEAIVFAVRPTVVSALWDDYMYGFYYTENDEPIDVVWGEDVEENEFESEIVGFGGYWYRTEKITDHWWFYETKTLWLYPSAHRG